MQPKNKLPVMSKEKRVAVTSRCLEKLRRSTNMGGDCTFDSDEALVLLTLFEQSAILIRNITMEDDNGNTKKQKKNKTEHLESTKRAKIGKKPQS